MGRGGENREQTAFRLLAERHGLIANPRVFVYAAGGYYYPRKDLPALRGEMRDYLDRGYNVVKMKIGGAPIAGRSHAHRGGAGQIGKDAQLAVDANGPFDLQTASTTRKTLRDYPLFWYEEPATPSTSPCRPHLPNSIPGRWRPVKTCSAIRMRETCCVTAACAPIATGCNSTARCLMGSANTTHAGGTQDDGLVGEPLRPPWRPPDVAQYRRRPRTWWQWELSDLFQPDGGFPDGVRVENGHITMPDLPGIGFEGKSDLHREMKLVNID